MNRTRTWIAGLSRGRLLLLTAPLVLGSCGAGAAALIGWNSGRRACATANEFSDSLTSNRIRLAAIDSVLLRYNLLDRPAIDSALEMRILELRMQGVTAPQIDRWLGTVVRLPLRANDGRSPAADSGGTLARIQARENDGAYVRDLHRHLQVTYDYWHDMTVLSPLVGRWNARCSAYRRGMAIGLPLWAIATSLVFLCWWWGVASRQGTS